MPSVQFKITYAGPPVRNRLLNFSEVKDLTWSSLASRVGSLYKIPEEDVGLVYVDSENDDILMSTDEELRYYLSCNMTEGTVIKFTIILISSDSPSMCEQPPITEANHLKEIVKLREEVGNLHQEIVGLKSIFNHNPLINRLSTVDEEEPAQLSPQPEINGTIRTSPINPYIGPDTGSHGYEPYPYKTPGPNISQLPRGFQEIPLNPNSRMAYMTAGHPSPPSRRGSFSELPSYQQPPQMIRADEHGVYPVPHNPSGVPSNETFYPRNRVRNRTRHPAIVHAVTPPSGEPRAYSGRSNEPTYEDYRRSQVNAQDPAVSYWHQTGKQGINHYDAGYGDLRNLKV